MAATDARIEDFEALVRNTARIYARQVNKEVEDLEQELRVRVWRVIELYDPSRGRPLRNCVFGAITNKIKDFKRDAAREARRRADHELTFVHIEDYLDGDSAQERVDALGNNVGHGEVYGAVEEGLLPLPSTLTDLEATVLVLLMYAYAKTEIAQRLQVSVGVVNFAVLRMRRKLADWEPSADDLSLPRVRPGAEAGLPAPLTAARAV